MRTNGLAAAAALGLAGLAFCGGVARSTPLTVISVSHFLDVRQPNAAGIAVGPRLALSAVVTPPVGTSVRAEQGGTAGNVPYLFSPASPNEFFLSMPYDPALTGSWRMTISNSTTGVTGSPIVRDTPSVGSVAPPPFVVNATISGAGATPTIAWTRPTGYVPDSQSIRIFDATERTPLGGATLIHNASLPSATATSYAVPSTLSSGLSLKNGHLYVFSVEMDERRTDNSLLARSRSFVSFSPLTASFTGTVYLPAVLPDPLPGDMFGAPFGFDIGVTAGTPILIDPVIAVGYDYAIGSGDPFFETFALPDLGDPGYELWLWNGSEYVFSRSVAPLEVVALPGGTDRFRILGISPDLALDPANTTAFVTQLTFAASGRFTGTMTPLLLDVPDTTSVPAPGALGLLVAALGMLAAMRRGRGGARATAAG